MSDPRLRVFEQFLGEWNKAHWGLVLQGSKKLEATTNLESLLTQIMDQDLDLPTEMDSAFWTFASLGFGAQSAGKTVTEFVEEALKSVLLQSEEFGQDEDTRLVHDSLVELLSTTNPVGLSIKAAALGNESHNVYNQCRIVSDVRHVFPEDVEQGPVGTIVVHNLKVGYTGDGLQKAVYFSCDRSDLEELQTAIGRALEKESSLRESIDKKIPSIRGN